MSIPMDDSGIRLAYAYGFSFPHDRVIDTLFLFPYRLLFNRLIRFLILLKYVLNPF